MTLNEKGIYTEAFCLNLDMESPFQWIDKIGVYQNGISDEGRQVIEQAGKLGDVYEKASMTFYPNGTMRIEYTLKDSMYDAFATGSIFRAAIPRSVSTEHTYAVHLAEGILKLDGNTAIKIDPAKPAFYSEYFTKNECFHIPGEVTGEPAEMESNYEAVCDIPYGKAEQHVMDVYLPKEIDFRKPQGAFLIVYGGGWTGGDKSACGVLAQRYASEGYIAVGFSMRNAAVDEEAHKTTTSIYDMLEDIHGVVRKLKEMSDENGWHITQCALKGFSSGGNLALLYAYSRGMEARYFDTEEILPVRFVVDVVGPVDFHDSAWFDDEEWPAEDRTLYTKEGAGRFYAMLLTGASNEGELKGEALEECIHSISPVWYVDQGGGIPTLMGYSARDIIQDPNNGKLLKRHLDERKVENILYTFPNSIHSYGSDPELAQEFHEKTIAYAERYFREE